MIFCVDGAARTGPPSPGVDRRQAHPAGPRADGDLHWVPDLHKGAGIPIGTVLRTEGALDAGPAPTDDVWSALRRHDAEPGRIHRSGYPATTAEPFRDWTTSAGGTSYDSIIGRVGGGNHFAELQYVAAVHDKRAAYAWGSSSARSSRCRPRAVLPVAARAGRR